MLAAALSAPAAAGVMFTLAFDDPFGRFTGLHPAIATSFQAAGRTWSDRLAASGTIEVLVQFADIPTAAAASTSAALVRSEGSRHYYEQGAAYKLRTGIDGTAGAADALLLIGPQYLRNELYLDPNPQPPPPGGAGLPVPADRTDAYSVFLHEIAHMLAFNSFAEPSAGPASGDTFSTYDAFVRFDGSDFYFTGPAASAVHGGPVPLTYGSIAHLGNLPPRPGAELAGDLMGGVFFERGRRYAISALDLAIFCDVGVTTTACLPAGAVPAPPTWLLIAAGALCALRRSARVGAAHAALRRLARRRRWAAGSACHRAGRAR